MDTTVDIAGRMINIYPGDPAVLQTDWGRIDFANLEIIYSRQIHPDNQREAVLHELLHLSDFITSTDKNCLTEEQTNRIGGILYGILRDNRELTNWLFMEE